MSFTKVASALVLTVALTACNDGSSGDAALISGTPTAIVAANTEYSFRPQSNGQSLSFSIQNKPAWASFSVSTGELSGIPTVADTGDYSNIVISVNGLTLNGSNSKGKLPPFGIRVVKSGGNGSSSGGSGSSSSSSSSGATPSGASTSGAGTSSGTGSSSGGTVSSGGATSGGGTSSGGGGLSSSSGTSSIGGSSSGAVASNGGSSSGVTSSSGSSSSSGGKSSSGSGSSGGSSSSSSGSSSTSTTSVTLSWAAPTQNTDGSALVNLAGFNIYYGTSPSALSNQISINTVGMLSYVITDLNPGTWYFEVVAVNAAGSQSAPSGVISTTL